MKHLESLFGAPTYCASEMIEGCHDHSVDYWCLDIATYHMLAGSLPFNEQADLKTEER